MWKFCSVLNLYSSHFKNMYMDCLRESEEHLLHRLYSSWGLDHLLEVGIGYSKLDVGLPRYG